MYSTAQEAVKLIESNQRVFIHGVSAVPQTLIKAMVERADELRNVELVHLHTEGEAPYAKQQYKDSFRVNSLFVGSNVRNAVNDGRGDYIPIFLSEIPKLFREKILPIDVAMFIRRFCRYSSFSCSGCEESNCASKYQYAQNTWRWLDPCF